MNEIIRLENVVKVAPDGRRALSGVSLSINEREHVQIRGGAGSGKTTLLRLIAGMDTPDSGQVSVADRVVHEMNASSAAIFRNRALGVCIRDPSLMSCLAIWENVALPLTIRGIPNAQRRKAAMDRLKAVGIVYAAHARPAALSPYEVRLASLARALVTSPPILLLDEITADLPEQDGKRIMNILGAIIKLLNTTLVVFTSGEGCVPGTERRFTLEYGTIREENQ